MTAVPALWIKQGKPDGAAKALPLGAPIGLLMALGSISFVLALSKLSVGMATGISVSYVLLVMALSWTFLNESMSWMKLSGRNTDACGRRAALMATKVMEPRKPISMGIMMNPLRKCGYLFQDQRWGNNNSELASDNIKSLMRPGP